MTTVVLRGHHLICLRFFIGYGYSLEFVRRVRKVLERVRKSKIRVVVGFDDICKFCPVRGDCRVPKDLDVLALRILRVRGFVRWDEIKVTPKALKIWELKACKGCRWYKICRSQLTSLAGWGPSLLRRGKPAFNY